MTRPEVPTLRDAAPLAALAHPFRSRIMDALKVDGPSTASMLAARTGQAVGNASHHLKVLAAAGLVKEAPELARDRRERWWRLVSAAPGGAGGTSSTRPPSPRRRRPRRWVPRRQQERLHDWMGNADTDPEWEDAAFATQNWLKLSPADQQLLRRARPGPRPLGQPRGPRRRGAPEPSSPWTPSRANRERRHDGPGHRSAHRGQRQLPAALVRRGCVGARLDDHRGGRPARRRHGLRRGRRLDGAAHRGGLAALARRGLACGRVDRPRRRAAGDDRGRPGRGGVHRVGPDRLGVRRAHPPHLVVAALGVGTASVFLRAAYLPLLPRVVGPSDLAVANARLVGTESAMQVVGPGLGGALVAVVSAAYAVVVDVLSFLVSALCLHLMDPRRLVPPPRRSGASPCGGRSRPASAWWPTTPTYGPSPSRAVRRTSRSRGTPPCSSCSSSATWTSTRRAWAS